MLDAGNTKITLERMKEFILNCREPCDVIVFEGLFPTAGAVSQKRVEGSKGPPVEVLLDEGEFVNILKLMDQRKSGGGSDGVSSSSSSSSSSTPDSDGAPAPVSQIAEKNHR